ADDELAVLLALAARLQSQLEAAELGVERGHGGLLAAEDEGAVLDGGLALDVPAERGLAVEQQQPAVADPRAAQGAGPRPAVTACRRASTVISLAGSAGSGFASVPISPPPFGS